MMLTLAVVFALPIGGLIALGFFSMTGLATVGDRIALENYRNFFTDIFLPAHSAQHVLARRHGGHLLPHRRTPE